MAAAASATLVLPSRGKPEELEYLDLQSIKDVCRRSPHALVYGYISCQYKTIGHMDQSPLLQDGSPIQRVFNWTMFMSPPGDKANTTLEGRCTLFTLPALTPHYDGNGLIPTREGIIETARRCKQTLVLLAVENYKRAREGLPLIPVIFCIEIDNSPYPSIREYPLLAALNRSQAKDGQLPMVTDKEVRRYDKLCSAEFPDLPPESAARFRRVSRAAIRWVRLERVGKGTYALRKISSPLDSPDWAYYSRMRQKLSRSVPKADPFNWKKALSSEISRFDAAFDRKHPCLLRYRCHPVQ